VLDAGFLDSCIVEGAFNSDTFLQALHQCVLPHMNPWPMDRSVLLLDNCNIHKSAAVRHAVCSIGARVLFLEPYDPESMPVEVAYRAMKNWLRREGPYIQHLTHASQLRMAMRAVGKGASRNA